MSETLQVQVALLQQREREFSRRLDEQDAVCKDLAVEVGKLRVKLSEVSMQIKITWGFMFLLISSIVGVAFSLWK